MGEWLTDVFFGWIYDVFYTLQKSICYLLDFIRDIFCKLAGIETVKIDGGEEEILTHFITSPAIRNAFLGVLLVGVILLFVFVIVAIIKSEAADPQHKKTKGQILVKSLQSFIIFLLIPFLLIAGIMLANVVVGAIHASMTGSMLDGNTASTIGGQILVTSGYDAYIGPAGSRAEIERMFVTGQLDYNSLSVVKRYYDLSEMNFFVGIAGGLVILVMFVMSAVMFVQRIFDIILLYIVSPASVSTIPLDDGGRFRIWREMLVSKVLSAYGIILSMNIFFLVVPQISQITFFGNAFKDGIVQLLFVIGGAFSITKANMIITSVGASQEAAIVKLEKPLDFDRHIQADLDRIVALAEANENGNLSDGEYAARIDVIQDRLVLADTLNTEQQVKYSCYYIAVTDRNKTSLMATLSVMRGTLLSGSIEARILKDAELAKFIALSKKLKVSDGIDVPREVSFRLTSAIQDGRQLSHFVVTGYPLKVPNAWGEELFDLPNTKVVMKLKPVEKSKALKRIDTAIMELSTQAKGKASKIIDKTTHVETLSALLARLQNDNEVLFDTTFIITA